MTTLSNHLKGFILTNARNPYTARVSARKKLPIF